MHDDLVPLVNDVVRRVLLGYAQPKEKEAVERALTATLRELVSLPRCGRAALIVEGGRPAIAWVQPGDPDGPQVEVPVLSMSVLGLAIALLELAADLLKIRAGLRPARGSDPLEHLVRSPAGGFKHPGIVSAQRCVDDGG